MEQKYRLATGTGQLSVKIWVFLDEIQAISYLHKQKMKGFNTIYTMCRLYWEG